MKVLDQTVMASISA